MSSSDIFRVLTNVADNLKITCDSIWSAIMTLELKTTNAL